MLVSQILAVHSVPVNVLEGFLYNFFIISSCVTVNEYMKKETSQVSIRKDQCLAQKRIFVYLFRPITSVILNISAHFPYYLLSHVSFLMIVE